MTSRGETREILDAHLLENIDVNINEPAITLVKMLRVKRAWKLFTSGKFTLTDVFHPLEENYFNSLKIEKRKKEFLSSTLAIKLAWLEDVKLSWPLNQILIRRDPFGKPYLTLVKNNNVNKYLIIDDHFSLSHVNGRLLIMRVKPGFMVGIDLEVLKEKSTSFMEIAFSRLERNLLSREKDFTLALHAGWTAKEAVSKLLGVGLRIPLKQIKLVHMSLKEMTSILSLDQDFVNENPWMRSKNPL